LFRTGDVFIPLGAKSTFSLDRLQSPTQQMPVCIPASRLLRQYDPSLPMMNKQRLRRIMNEMTYAAEHDECFHLWWHPENFGFHPEQSLGELEQILQHFHNLQQRCGLRSLTMEEVANLCQA
jgi:hypothetical protein